MNSGGDSSSHSDATEQTLLVSGISRSRGGAGVQLSLLRVDSNSRLQRFLLDSVHNVKEAYSIFRRLGLPQSSVSSKLPYHQRWEKNRYECTGLCQQRAVDHRCMACRGLSNAWPFTSNAAH